MKNLFSLMVILGLIYSCQEKDTMLEEPNVGKTDIPSVLSRSFVSIVFDSVWVNEGGALVFETPTAYLSITDSLARLSNEELDIWESTIGFNSYRRKLNSIYQEIGNEVSSDRFFEIS